MSAAQARLKAEVDAGAARGCLGEWRGSAAHAGESARALARGKAMSAKRMRRGIDDPFRGGFLLALDRDGAVRPPPYTVHPLSPDLAIGYQTRG